MPGKLVTAIEGSAGDGLSQPHDTGWTVVISYGTQIDDRRVGVSHG